jgi:hypothetical protein
MATKSSPASFIATGKRAVTKSAKAKALEADLAKDNTTAAEKKRKGAPKKKGKGRKRASARGICCGIKRKGNTFDYIHEALREAMLKREPEGAVRVTTLQWRFNMTEAASEAPLKRRFEAIFDRHYYTDQDDTDNKAFQLISALCSSIEVFALQNLTRNTSERLKFVYPQFAFNAILEGSMKAVAVHIDIGVPRYRGFKGIVA